MPFRNEVVQVVPVLTLTTYNERVTNRSEVVHKHWRVIRVQFPALDLGREFTGLSRVPSQLRDLLDHVERELIFLCEYS